MKKIVKFAGNFIFAFIAVVLLAYIIGMRFFPEQLKNIVGYQTFVILTDSMEPTIPVGSLVVSKDVEEGEDIPPDTIISFHVDRLGDDVIFTHYFKKKEADETGKERYYTQAENADRYDDYKTYREDILGTYIFHIPYAGKIVQFLQSPFALIELGLILIILIIYYLLWNKFDREEKALMEMQMAADVIDSGPDEPDFEIRREGAVLTEESPPSIMETEEITVADASAEEAEEPCAKPEMVNGQPEISGKVLFGYRMAPSSGAFESGSAGFSLTVEVDGTVRYEAYAGGKGKEAVRYSRLSGRSLKKLKKIMKDSQLVIRNLPETLDNGFSIGRGSFFIFRGRMVTAWNIRHNNLKKMKAKDYTYYKKYKKNMKHENDVLELFKKIRNVLREEGIKINLDLAEIKAGK